MIRGRILIASIALGLLGAAAGVARAQQQYAAGEARAPRFWLASSRGEMPIPLDVRRTTVLMRRIAVDLDGVSLSEALAAISARAGLTLVYGDGVVPADKRVHLRAEQITVVGALTDVLADVGVDVVFNARGGATLVPRAALEGVLPATGTITGRVTEAKTGNAVPLAQVSVVGTSLARTSGEDGRYTISGVAAGAHSVTAKRLGYEPMTREVSVADGGSVTADFELVGAISRLAEIVTTVTGGQRRVELGHTVGVINADSLVATAPITSLGDVISGRVAGVEVRYNSGATGSSPSVRIRGINSFTLANDPLLYVDGVRVANSAANLNNFSPYGWTSGRFNDLNPEEIESIEIVKGPSAATLYGTDAANGVILVRTKHGAAGRGSWHAYTELGRLDTPIDFRPAYRSWGKTTAGVVTQCLLTQAAAGTCTIDSVTKWNPFNNAATTPLRVGDRAAYGAQTSGGSASLQYFLSGGYETETGPLQMPKAEQARVSLERGGAAILDEQVHPNGLRKVSLRGSTSAALSSSADVVISTGLTSSSLRVPTTSIFSSGIWSAGYRDANDGWRFGRPGELFAIGAVEKVLHSISSATATWRPFLSVQTRATTGLDFSTTEFDGLQRRGEGPLGVTRDGQRTTQGTNLSIYSADLGATMNRTLRPLVTSRTSLGLQYARSLQRVTSVSATGLAPGSETVVGAAAVSGSEQTVETVVAGGYAEQMIGLNDRLFVTGALRLDGGSAFGKDFSTALYPKISASWLVIDNASRQPSLTSVRLRAAYGASGVQPSAIAALPVIGLSTAIVDGVSVPGGRLTALGNRDLKPERTAELETGADVELWGDRLRLEGTYYLRRSSDALVNVPLAASSGLASRIQNIGATQNQGVEASVNARLVSSSVVAWDVALNGSVNTNRLVHLAPGVQVSQFEGNRNVPGYPLFGLWARPILGFQDLNGDGLITQNEITVGDSLAFFGSAFPRDAVGVSSSASILDNRVRIATQLDYRGGYKTRDLMEITSCAAFAVCRAVNDPKAPLDAQAYAVARRTPALGSTSAGYTIDGSYLRWRELSLTYVGSPSVARRLRSKTASVTLAGRNLGVWTRLPSGVDPEAMSTPAIPSVIDAILLNPAAPPSRYFIVRLNLGL